MPEERTCRCGVVFTVPKPSDPKKYCTHACAVRYQGVPTKQLVCQECGKVFEFKGRTRALHCVDCRPLAHSRRVGKWKAAHGITEKLGVGRGGNQRGDKNPAARARKAAVDYGLTAYRKICYQYWPRACVLCDSTQHLEVNHIDCDVTNNCPSNLVPLCRSCHRAIHKLSRRSVRSNEEILFFLWPSGRIKIAEKIGNPEMGIRGEGLG